MSIFTNHLLRRWCVRLLLAAFLVVVALYVVDPVWWRTSRLLRPIPHTMTVDNMLSSLNVTAIAKDGNSLMWIGTSAGINVFDGNSYIQFFHDTKDTTALPDDYINCLHLDKMGRMWVGTQNGLARYEGNGRFRRFALPMAESNVVRIGDDRRGKGVVVAVAFRQRICCYAVSETGVTSVDGSRLLQKTKATIPDAPYSLRKPEEIVSCSYADGMGNVWVGFRNAGYQVVSSSGVAFKHANDNRLAQVTRGKDIIAVERVGDRLLAGTTLRLYVYDERRDMLSETFYDKLFRQMPDVKPSLNNIVPLDNRRVWLVGNREVVACDVSFDEPKVMARHTGDGLGNVDLGCGVKMGGALYVAEADGHLLSMDFATGVSRRIPVGNAYYDEETQLLSLGKDSLLLFMRNMHLAIYSPSNGEISDMSVDGCEVPGNVDPAFARKDSYGNVWLGTKRSGLYRLDIRGKKVERMDILGDVHVQGIVEDTDHNLWITTLKDVVCYNPRNGEVLLNSLVSSSHKEWQRQFFDNSLCVDFNGNVVLGSSDGCYSLPTSSLAHGVDGSPSDLRIYSLSVTSSDGARLALGEDIGDGMRYTFSHDKNTLCFGFFYPNYGASSTLMYQCKLEGFDDDWHEPGYVHEAQYANLSPGSYTFRLRLVASPGSQPLCERSVGIVIKPAWWMSGAAWLLYVACFVALVYYVNTLYLRLRANRLNLLNERREREREQRANEMNMSFFANISHEFRNPLTLIAGPLMALRADESLSVSVRHSLQRVCLSVNRMLRLIDQMLDFNQLESDALRLKVSYVDALVEMRHLVDAFEESARVRGITLDVSHDCDAPYEMLLDTDKFEKIMSNLFTNALKHTPDNGRIAISMSTFDTIYEGRRLEVDVFNSGSHISANRLSDVFKRYYQLTDVDAQHKYGWGTGLGLYYVRRLVELHHGEISVRNVNGEDGAGVDGVAFRFVLPMGGVCYDGEKIAGRESRVMQIPVDDVESESLSPVDDVRPKILVVDDDVDVARYIRSIFAAEYNVVNRYSAESALRDMADIRPDIILSDVIMGEMSGYDFCRTLKSDTMWSHIPVVLITAKSGIDEQISGLRLGAVAYVAKPFDPTYLKALVSSQLDNMATLRQRLSCSVSTEETADIADSMSDADRRFMDELYDAMERRLAEFDLNVSTICRDMLVSQSKFNYKLKQLTGDTPGVFFRKYKLNRAARLLRDGSHNVSEVALMTGFGTAAHFSVAFKKQFGVAPSEYH